MLLPLLLAGALLPERAYAEPEMIPPEAMEDVGHAATDFEVPLKGGGTFKLSAHSGRRVVVSFWASWCGPCRAELPALSKLAASYPNVDFLALNVDRERKAADGFLDKVAVTLPIAYDQQAVTMGNFGVTSMPTIFLIAADGTVALKHVGYGAEHGFTDLEAALGAK